MQKKVLVLGVEQNNFLSFLYGTLKKAYPDLMVSVPKYHELSDKSSVNDWMYNNEGLKQHRSLVSFVQAFFSVLVSKHFYQTFFFILVFELKLKKAAHFFVESVKGKAFFLTNANFKTYDTFHFHYLQYSYLRELFFVPKGKKIVCSFWGSDLMRTSDTFNHYFVGKALRKATVITCQSLEMREILLSKFGRELLDKVVVITFPIDQKVFDGIDSKPMNSEALEAFKKDFQYGNDKINVQIGHNANPQNNHLSILEGFEKVSFKDKLHLVVHLGYGISKEEKQSYTNLLHQQLNKTGIPFTLSDDFFVDDSLVFSRLATDIFIHLPVSDALSATMTEMLYAGSVVITGSWLPYKTFRKIGLHYHEIEDFKELPEKLNFIMANLDSERQKCQQNRAVIRAYFFRNEIAATWAEILN
ncbi:hypothetical protein [Flavobacterium pedocola]